MKHLSFAVVFTLSLIVSLLVSTNQPAQGFTKGKTIQIYLGVSPGGGHDTEARMIARWLPKYLPGEPKKHYCQKYAWSRRFDYERPGLQPIKTRRTHLGSHGINPDG